MLQKLVGQWAHPFKCAPSTELQRVSALIASKRNICSQLQSSNKRTRKPNKVPHGYWKDENVQREALEKIGREELGVKELDDWYSVNPSLLKGKLSFISNEYNGSLFKALKKLYPHYHWNPLKLSTQVPRGFWKDVKVQKDALEALGRERFGVKELDDWYKVNTIDVTSELSFINAYYGSLFNALKTLYPNHNWDVHRLARFKHDLWTDDNVQRDALERIGREKLGVKELDDWYSVNASDVVNKLKFVRYIYNSSLEAALKKLYPHHNWDPLKLSSQVPRGYWSDLNTQRDALEKFGREQLGVKQLDDWYKVNAADVYGVLSFVKSYYNGSLFNALKVLYPHHDWDPLKLSTQVPRGYWSDENVQRDALERIGRELGVKELDDWYSVRPNGTQKLNFINNYYGSLFNALIKLYPQHNWDVHKLSKFSHSYWKDENAQRDALEKIGREELGVKELDDWYSVDASKVTNKLGFINNHHGTLFYALKKLYPHHDWDPLRFSKVPQGHWDDEDAQRDALERFGRQKLGVKELDDWYSVSTTAVANELHFIKSHHKGSLVAALTKLYPQHNWDPLRFINISRGYWQQPETAQFYHKLLTKWKNEHNIQTARDWYQLSPHQVQVFKRVAKGIFHGKNKLLAAWFPENTRFNTSMHTSQLELQEMLKRLVSDVNTKQFSNNSLHSQTDASLEQLLQPEKYLLPTSH